jgi:hypothetical protein
MLHGVVTSMMTLLSQLFARPSSFCLQCLIPQTQIITVCSGLTVLVTEIRVGQFKILIPLSGMHFIGKTLLSFAFNVASMLGGFQCMCVS